MINIYLTRQGKMNMENCFIPLEDTDILMLGKDTFIIERLKELLTQKITEIFNSPSQNNITIAHKLRHVPIGEIKFNAENSKWIFPTEGQECQLLKIGYQGWQKGKMRIQVSINWYLPSGRGSSYTYKIAIYLEFCPEKILNLDSSLDDIRQSEEYKQL